MDLFTTSMRPTDKESIRKLKESKDIEMVEHLTRKSFNMVDSDGDGWISGQDLHKLIQEISTGGYGGDTPSKRDCDCALFSITSDLGQRINFDQWKEFVTKFLAKVQSDEQKAHEIADLRLGTLSGLSLTNPRKRPEFSSDRSIGSKK